MARTALSSIPSVAPSGSPRQVLHLPALSACVARAGEEGAVSVVERRAMRAVAFVLYGQLRLHPQFGRVAPTTIALSWVTSTMRSATRLSAALVTRALMLLGGVGAVVRREGEVALAADLLVASPLVDAIVWDELVASVAGQLAAMLHVTLLLERQRSPTEWTQLASADVRERLGYDKRSVRQAIEYLVQRDIVWQARRAGHANAFRFSDAVVAPDHRPRPGDDAMLADGWQLVRPGRTASVSAATTVADRARESDVWTRPLADEPSPPRPVVPPSTSLPAVASAPSGAGGFVLEVNGARLRVPSEMEAVPSGVDAATGLPIIRLERPLS